MRTGNLFQALGLLFASLAKAAPATGSLDLGPDLSVRDDDYHLALRDDHQLEKRVGQTCNTPTNRACWTSNFNINTDYEASIPPGIVRPYTLTLTENPNWKAPDGTIKEVAMLINGGFPGPTLTADWGDTFQVTVINNLKTNGTSFHWHGIRQLNNSENDGVNGITQCPIPPGQSQVYTFRAEQYGSSWYHSHFSAQYGNGVVGSIVINGPSSLNYDIDLGVFPITDWYNKGADHIIEDLIPPPGAAPLSDNVFFNGTNVDPQGGSGGKRARVQLTPGKRHLLRIINTSVENNFAVTLANHTMTVIQTDFVPVNAYTTSSLFVGLGQRYHVTIDASQAVDNYWFNITYPANGVCGGTNATSPPAAIFSYVGANQTATPTNPGTVPPNSKCEDSTNYVPIVTRTAPKTSFNETAANDIQLTLGNAPWVDPRTGVNETRVYWYLNGQNINITWGDPTLEYVAQGNMNYPPRYNVFQVPQSNTWAYWVIENEFGLPHPVHLHGHDFLILGRSPAVDNPFTIADRRFNPATDLANLNFNNPTRRDVTMLPGNGWLVLAFRTDNPGAWLFHCHIAWHVSQGLSVQFLERVQDIPSAVNLAAIQNNCNNWNNYYQHDTTPQIDSGL